MAERVLILASLALLSVAFTLAARAWVRRGAARLRASDQQRLWSALGERPDGRPSVVVFSSPGCVACRTAQEPALQQVVAGASAGLRLIHVDIGDNPAAARAFNVLTAPSTAVLDGDGRLQDLNQGFASADVLRAQVNAAGGAPASVRSPKPPGRRAHAEPAPAVHR